MRLLSFVPGGCATISMPLSSGSSCVMSCRSQLPPLKSVWKVNAKFLRICSKVSANCLSEVALISSIALSSWSFEAIRSSLCV